MIPGLGRSSRGENGNPLQYSCLEKSRRSLASYSPGVHKESDMTDFKYILQQSFIHICKYISFAFALFLYIFIVSYHCFTAWTYELQATL